MLKLPSYNETLFENILKREGKLRPTIMVLLIIPKSRLATEVKAEFTEVNEHFTDGV